MVETTPFNLSNGGSIHQKQPPAKVAFSSRRRPAECPAGEVASSNTNETKMTVRFMGLSGYESALVPPLGLESPDGSAVCIGCRHSNATPLSYLLQCRSL